MHFKSKLHKSDFQNWTDTGKLSQTRSHVKPRVNQIKLAFALRASKNWYQTENELILDDVFQKVRKISKDWQPYGRIWSEVFRMEQEVDNELESVQMVPFTR